MKKVLLTVATLSLLLLATTAHANLIANGDFSDGLNSWTTNGQSVKIENGAAILGNGSDPAAGQSKLSQSFFVEPGTEKLYISFDLSFKGFDNNLLLSDTFSVVVSDLQIELHSVLWWTWEEEVWTDHNIYSWNSDEGYNTLNVKATVLLSPGFADRNPNAKITFNLSEVLANDPNMFLSTTLAISNINITPSAATPVPAAAWLLGSGLAGVMALRRKLR